MDIAALRAAVAAAQNPAPVLVTEVPVLGDVYVRVNSAKQGADARLLLQEKEEADKAAGLTGGRRLATLLCDEAGELAFDPRNDADVQALSCLPEYAVHRLVIAASRANFPEIDPESREGNA